MILVLSRGTGCKWKDRRESNFSTHVIAVITLLTGGRQFVDRNNSHETAAYKRGRASVTLQGRITFIS